ncbi:Poly(A)-specific ribonuclease PARN-like domain-containing protein 1 [Melipona quadrifasciata]|uniref:Poly(A)-specific ribonuclease PARN-like domain-containing protein 1 n=1 Tax=Melipona quadrifasciata TaxID=166423 RepID=A0A0M9A428_9HYME|nr:Poly(A)-specific ribonuclease PARN-like domain-containing protein 1 [Melipona quadrifasciata]
MEEVLDSNFESLYPQIESAINNANFIAIDAEFSGIYSENHLIQTLFDTLNDRYETLKKNIQQFAIVQFGIATFHHIPFENAYETKCFNFYLFPKSVPLQNRKLSWQVTSLNFLCKHNFDFNKFLNDGICYLNEPDEKLLKDCLTKYDLANIVEHLLFEEEIELNECKNQISKWMARSEDLTLKLQVTNPTLQYILHKDLRNNYNNIWTASDNKSISMLKIKSDVHNFMLKQEDNLDEVLLNSLTKFSKIFKLLSSSKKFIVGHNVLLDLMFMHQQFYKPLPDSYVEFKNNIHTLFPEIYDTKFLSFELRKLYNVGATWELSSLSALYEYFTTRGGFLSFNSPKIVLFEECSTPSQKRYHTAGWDAYFTGCIFVKMAHIFCIKKFGPGLEERIVTHSELINSVKKFVNSVNISRSNEMYMKFGEEDPILSRPEWLHVKLKSPSIDIKELIKKFSSFGSVDVMPFAHRCFLVAVSNHNRTYSATCALDGERYITCLPKNTSRGDSIRSPSSIGLARMRGDSVGPLNVLCQQKEETIENTHTCRRSGLTVSKSLAQLRIVMFHERCGPGCAFALAWIEHLSRLADSENVFNEGERAPAPKRSIAITWCAEINCLHQLPTEITILRLTQEGF